MDFFVNEMKTALAGAHAKGVFKTVNEPDAMFMLLYGKTKDREPSSCRKYAGKCRGRKELDDGKSYKISHISVKIYFRAGQSMIFKTCFWMEVTHV